MNERPTIPSPPPMPTRVYRKQKGRPKFDSALVVRTHRGLVEVEILKETPSGYLLRDMRTSETFRRRKRDIRKIVRAEF